MPAHFFEQPILNSPYTYPAQHWELDADGQPTDRIIETRRSATFITPVPKPKRRRQAGSAPVQTRMVLDEGLGLSTAEQEYDPTSIITAIRARVDEWRMLPDPGTWGVTPETARLLQHWRQHPFQDVRPFFAQVEAVETAIWLAEVAPRQRRRHAAILDHLESANAQSNPALFRLALKLATGAGKTTVMAMLIAWQTINAVRRQSYELNGAGLFDVEYADVLGIPFDFTAQPVVVKPTPPRETVRVYAVHPERDALEITFPRVAGYRLELPEERLSARFRADSALNLTPDLVGPSITQNQGILGESVELNVQHLRDIRQSTIIFRLTQRLLYTQYRDPGEEPKLHLFGQLKRIVRAWLDGGYLRCRGDTYPAQVLYQEIADLACQKIKAAISEAMSSDRPIKAILDAYNPTGSTMFVNFTTSKTTRWQTDPRRSHINWVVCDSDWEAELCRVVEAHPRVRAYVKNQGLGLEVPYQFGAQKRTYLPDFIVQIDDGQPDPLNLVVEIKGFRGEDAKEKATTMRTYWVPGVNNLGRFGRWAFAEFTDVYAIAEEFRRLVDALISPPGP